MGSLVRTLNDHLKSEPEPPDLRPSSNVDFPVAWITGPATDPIFSDCVTLHGGMTVRELAVIFKFIF
jgi:hypothetical protein